MTRMMMVLAIAVAAAAAPAGAAPLDGGAYSDHVHIVQSGAFEIQGGVASGDEAPFEISMWAGTADVVLDTENGEEELEQGGCISLFRANVSESGCGTLEVVADGLMQTTRLVGSIDSAVSDYVNDPEHGPTFIYREDSVIRVDLTFTGDGLIRPRQSHRTGLVLCGLPPDTQGASLLLEAPVERSAVATGTFASDVLGSIDPAVLQPEMIEARFVSAGAKLEGCL